jgi:hypothetical protein
MSDLAEASALLVDLSVQVYSPAWSRSRLRLGEWPAAVRTVVLVLDYETEVQMEGLLGFLENSTSRFLPETIDALQAIGAARTAEALREIRDELTRGDFWSETHPEVEPHNQKTIERFESKLDLYERTDEQPRELLEAYVAPRLDEIREGVARVLELGADPLWRGTPRRRPQ